MCQIKSNLGRLILKEEKEEQEKALLDIGRRKTQSLPDRTHMHTSKLQSIVYVCECVCSNLILIGCADVFRFLLEVVLQFRSDQGECTVCLHVLQ